jgi:hypothetical protein
MNFMAVILAMRCKPHKPTNQPTNQNFNFW